MPLRLLFLRFQIDAAALWLVNFVIILFVILIVAFIFTYLSLNSKLNSRSKKIISLFSEMVSEIILSENEEELKQVISQHKCRRLLERYLPKRFARKAMASELIKMHRNMSGVAANNIEWLFNKLDLHNDALNDLKSTEWHIKAKAIQYLAEMKQMQFLPRIYKMINHSNIHIRTEAQLGLVKMTGFEGLRFLNITRYPVTQWQQICLLQELPKNYSPDEQKITKWFKAENESVIEFAIKLARKYQCIQLEKEINYCIHHKSVRIRKQALIAMQELYSDQLEETVTFCT